MNSGGSVRYGEEANTVFISPYWKIIKDLESEIKKTGYPSGNVTAKVRRRSDDAVVSHIQ